MLVNTELFACRFSNDKILNTRGRNILEFMSLNLIALLNGRTSKDRPAQFTHVSSSGNSVIDSAWVNNSFSSFGIHSSTVASPVEQKLPEQKPSEQKLPELKANKKSTTTQNLNSNKTEIPNKKNTHPNNNKQKNSLSVRRGSPPMNGNELSKIVLQKQTKIKLNEYIHLNDVAEHRATSSQALDRNYWVQVTNKKKNRQQRLVIVGNNSNVDVKGVPKHVTLHVYGLNESTSTSSLTTLLKQNFPEVICESMTPKYLDLYTPYNVTIFANNFKTAMDSTVWPQGECESRFLDLTRRSQMKT
ncbi:hypothetical protein JTB14_027343 [Gonioctena quinquepunctata]|nr:hypothetical protein JTB14_027343 [Gonioctena quinquepunctata]